LAFAKSKNQMVTEAHTSKYRRQPDTDLSRMEIVQGAALCFEERGYAATSLDEVAARIHSTKGRIYHHYASKAELFFDVYRTGMTENFAAIAPFLEGEKPPIDRLISMVRAHIKSVIHTRPFQKVVGEGVDLMRRGSMPATEHAILEELASLRDAYSEHFMEFMSAARADGDISYKNSKIALNQLFMCMNGPITWFSPRKGQPEEEIEMLVDECAAYAMRLLGYSGDLPQLFP